WYQSYFENANGALAIGEGSVTYCSPIRQPKTISRIVKDLGELRIIHIARHPLKRMESSWRHWQARLTDSLVPFREAIEGGHLLQNSLYRTQLEPFREHFGDDRLLTLQFEEFTANPTETLARVWRFLEVDPNAEISVAGANVNPSENL